MTKYRCAICNRRLAEGEYVFSRFTKSRYCLNVGCGKRKRSRNNG